MLWTKLNCDGFLRIHWFSPVSIIAPLLHTYLHLNTTHTRRTNGRCLWTLEKSNALSDMGEQWTEWCYRNVSVSPWKLKRITCETLLAVGFSGVGIAVASRKRRMAHSPSELYYHVGMEGKAFHAFALLGQVNRSMGSSRLTVPTVVGKVW
jgi:hypothetical protein